MIRFSRGILAALALARTCAASALTALPGSPAELRKRDGPTTIYVGPDPTCGYYGGKKESSVTCNPSFTCVVMVMESRANLGCCPGNDIEACPTILPTTWLGFDEADRSGYCTSGTCAVPTMTGVCDKRANGQYAVANKVLDPAAEAWICQPTGVEPLTIMTTYDGQKNAPPWQTAIAGATDTSDTYAHTSTTASLGTAEAQDNDNSNSSTPVGPIIGGVLGGIAVLALIGAGVLLISKGSKKQRKDTRYQPVSPLASPMQSLPSPSGSAKMPIDDGTKSWPQSPPYGQYGYGRVPGLGQPQPVSSVQSGWQGGLHQGIHEADGANIHEMPTVRHI